MTEADLPRVVEMAAVCYPDHFEAPAVYADRLRVFPRGCLVLSDGGQGQGYVLSHPWKADDAPPLNGLLPSLPERPDAYYLHDLALMPPARGQGHSRTALERLRGPAAGLPVSLVSVNGTVPFWERHGFAVRRSAAIDAKLASYGPDARFMVAP